MATIQQEGIFPVVITEAYVGEMPTSEKHPEPRYQVVLTGTTPAGDTATYYGMLTNTVVGGGKYKGRYVYEATLLGLKECGFAHDDPFDVELPEDQGGMLGRNVRYKVEKDEYLGNVRYKVAFVWADGAKKVDKEQRGSIWNSITGGKPIAPVEPAAAPELSEAEAAALLGSDELPF